MKDFLTLAAERYSVRSFQPTHLSKDKIDLLLKAAHLAPTGCNYQPQRILVLNTDDSMETLKACTKCHFNAPCAMLICYNREECWTRRYDGAQSGIMDASIVATHIMLEAADLGIGVTWVMHFDPTAMRERFKIPANVEPVALLVMGYPAEDAAPYPMHSVFRDPDEVIFYETFES